MIDIEHLRTWIGRTEQQSETVTDALVQRFAATFDAPAAAQDGEAAPTMIHLCLAPPAAPTAALGPDGHPERGGFLPPVPLARRMWAGGSFVFHSDIRIGERVTRRSTISDVRLRQGRTGMLCFVAVDHRIDSAGRLAVEERQDIVYRDASAPAAPAAGPAPQGTHRMVIRPSAALLFRYSALTFNGHRIHYDAPYARGVEGYPGLIVHGPLQASLLVRMAERMRGTRPARFGFRSLSPLFDDRDFTLNATDAGDGSMRLWTACADGPIAMEASAVW